MEQDVVHPYVFRDKDFTDCEPEHNEVHEYQMFSSYNNVLASSHPDGEYKHTRFLDLLR